MDDLFAHPGWRILLEDANAQIYQYQADALEQPNWDAVNVLRGKALQLAELINLEDVTLMQKRILEQEDDDADV
jgi:hypothetical protein